MFAFKKKKKASGVQNSIPLKAGSSEVLVSGWWEDGLGPLGKDEELGGACVCLWGVLCVCVHTRVSMVGSSWDTPAGILGRHRGNGRGFYEKTGTED